jgi:hypothetical protein
MPNGWRYCDGKQGVPNLLENHFLDYGMGYDPGYNSASESMNSGYSFNSPDELYKYNLFYLCKVKTTKSTDPIALDLSAIGKGSPATYKQFKEAYLALISGLVSGNPEEIAGLKSQYIESYSAHISTIED